MNNDFVSELKSFVNTPRAIGEVLMAQSQIPQGMDGIEFAKDQLSFLSQPWVAAVYDQMESVIGDKDGWSRMAHIAEQYGLNPDAAERLANEEKVNFEPQLQRLVYAVTAARTLSGMGLVDINQAVMAARAFVVQPQEFGREMGLLTQVSFMGHDERTMPTRIKLLMGKVQKKEIGYQQAMDRQSGFLAQHETAPIQKAQHATDLARGVKDVGERLLSILGARRQKEQETTSKPTTTTKNSL